MRMNRFHVIPFILATLVGCGRPAEDASQVLANVGGTKITEADLGKLVRALVKDPVQAQAILSQGDKGADRKGLLDQMAATRSVFQLAQAEGLDKDPRVQAQLETAMAQVYFNSLLERRAGALEPKEADLKAQYDEAVLQAKAAGQTSVPPFEQVKNQLASRWQQQQQQRVVGDLQKELQEKVPVTFVGREGGKK